jgi:hypothetical protein
MIPVQRPPGTGDTNAAGGEFKYDIFDIL